ncbi:MAG: hypothetical protein COT73_07845 [Bdellovibrio sp. CG10_big_fil_rev_8_21_14_0_10_47_8]|nr:MAG: hypothetical protein COT73_07845 [Bdellovibrio sp. CG10_big_fil_rev_8_21_14_0_10_47_8]
MSFRVGVLFSLIFSVASMAFGQTEVISLSQILSKRSEILKNLEKSDVSNQDRYILIQIEKNRIQTSLKEAILSGQARAQDLNHALSAYSKALDFADILTSMAELRLDESERFTPDGCSRARSQLKLEFLGEKLPKWTQKYLDLTNKLCAGI